MPYRFYRSVRRAREHLEFRRTGMEAPIVKAVYALRPRVIRGLHRQMMPCRHVPLDAGQFGTAIICSPRHIPSTGICFAFAHDSK
jgi:hypothetical protein